MVVGRVDDGILSWVRVGLAVIFATGVAVSAVVFFGHGTAKRARVPRSASHHKPTYGQLSLIADRVYSDREALAAQGVLLETVGIADGCVLVSLSNPTAPNVSFMRRRYRNLCVEPRPFGPVYGCAEGRGEARPGPVVVPDVGDLGLAEATRRLVAAGLSFTTGCIGQARVDKWDPSNVADGLARVVSQCPRAGQRVHRRTEVALAASAVLPGAFTYQTGASFGCANGRHATG